MTDSVREHRRAGQRSVNCAVVTVSDTRTWATDQSGPEIARWLEQAGHHVVERRLVPDDDDQIDQQLRLLVADDRVEAVLITGGTGLAARDRTVEVVSSRLTKMLPGYGELFRMLSFQQIGAAAMLSRAVGGLVGRVVVLTMPGSTAAVQLAMERLILPELGHLVSQARN